LKYQKGHYALVECEKRFLKDGKKFCLITQNVDGNHKDVGTKNVIEMHGNLFKTRCTKCADVEENRAAVIYHDDLPK
jgi:NAD-dependent SIR2 family protein deacetylase